MSEVFWLALALMLVLEGLLPMLAPTRWRQMFNEILKLHDGQIRFFGLCCVVAGLLLWWWLSPA
ncbi:MAG TPA: DUF2065 domain-containing protein [Burkholderiaceae bacterium]|nr:DUF2065 domain-containing protein [Burkholderiaceae bacterium]